MINILDYPAFTTNSSGIFNAVYQYSQTLNNLNKSTTILPFNQCMRTMLQRQIDPKHSIEKNTSYTNKPVTQDNEQNEQLSRPLESN